MGTTERKQRQKEEVHQAILKAAWNLVKEEGWQGLSIRKIADAIEYSVPVVYDHFENKEAILATFTRRGFTLLNEGIMSARMKHPQPEDQLKAVGRAYWNFAFTNNEYYQLMYGMGMPGCEAVDRMPEVKTFTQLLLETIALLGGDDKEMTKMKSLWSTLHGLVSIKMMADVDANSNDDVLLEQSMSSFLSGLNHLQNHNNNFQPSKSAIMAKTTWAIDPTHSDIQFKVKHLVISTVTGSFKEFSGSVTSQSDSFENAAIRLSIDVNSIDTNQPQRDQHLKSADFFETEKYPTIEFESTSFTKKSGDDYTLTGNLTMHGVTKGIELNVEYGGSEKDGYGNLKHGFEVSGKVNRKEFGLTYNSVTEAGGLALGEDIKFAANIQVAALEPVAA